MRRHHGVLEPEARLLAIWFSTPFIITGLVVLGFALERGWHYMIGSLAWGMYVFGIQITTVALTAYNLDSYPTGSGEVAAWLNAARTTGGFVVSYVQVRWANKVGTEKSFATQAGVCALFFGLIPLLQVFGRRLRRGAGELHFKTT